MDPGRCPSTPIEVGSTLDEDEQARLNRILRTRCGNLCTKSAVQALPDHDAQPNPYDTAIWWCARTTEALGPDGSCAEPGACDAPGRACYEPAR